MTARANDVVLGIASAHGVEVALLGQGTDVCAASDKGALESLPALVEEALEKAKCSITDIQLIGVCTGPGSFTGLRIGVAFAKSLAQARNLPIIGVSSYDVASDGKTVRPLLAVARGKRDYYYGRLISADGRVRFLQGPRESIERAAAAQSPQVATIVGPDFAESPRGSARIVAQLARATSESGASDHWTKIVIDYGQRPNAVVNWEQRQRAVPTRREGPALSRRELHSE